MPVWRDLTSRRENISSFGLYKTNSALEGFKSVDNRMSTITLDKSVKRQNPQRTWHHRSSQEKSWLMYFWEFIKLCVPVMFLPSVNAPGTPQQTRYIAPLLVQCWASVVDGGPTLNQHWDNVSCLLTLLFLLLTLRALKYLCINYGDQSFFSFWSHHKCLS